MSSTKGDAWSLVAQAFDHMKQALALLDECDAPPDIGAHLDLAISRLLAAFPALRD